MTSTATIGAVSPSGRAAPKAVAFVRCQATHVFAETSLKTRMPAEEEVCYIFGPCPACPPPISFPHDAAQRICPLCGGPFAIRENGTYFCPLEACWFARSVLETDTLESLDVWSRAYENLTNTYFLGKKPETVPTIEGLDGITCEEFMAAEALLTLRYGPIGNGK